VRVRGIMAETRQFLILPNEITCIVLSFCDADDIVNFSVATGLVHQVGTAVRCVRKTCTHGVSALWTLRIGVNVSFFQIFCVVSRCFKRKYKNAEFG